MIEKRRPLGLLMVLVLLFGLLSTGLGEDENVAGKFSLSGNSTQETRYPFKIGVLSFSFLAP